MHKRLMMAALDEQEKKTRQRIIEHAQGCIESTLASLESITASAAAEHRMRVARLTASGKAALSAQLAAVLGARTHACMQQRP